MKRSTKFNVKKVLPLILAPLLAFAGVALPRADAQTVLPNGADRMEYVPEALRSSNIDEKTGDSIPLDAVFTNEKGEDVTLGSLVNKGRPVILQLSYYGCPMLCSLVSQGLVDSLNKLPMEMGKDFDVINVSFDPTENFHLAAKKKESFLKAYDKPTGAENWHFLTGRPDGIDRLTKAVGFKYMWVDSAKQFSHPAVLMILMPDGRVSRYIYGVKYEPQTVKLALVEASDGKVGSAVDKFILSCFHWDGSQGRYAPQAMAMMRLGGVATVFTLAGIIGTSIYRERRRQSQATT